MNRRPSHWTVTLALLALAFAAPTWAADAKKTSPPEPTAEHPLARGYHFGAALNDGPC